jgi:hypothetical protein
MSMLLDMGDFRCMFRGEEGQMRGWVVANMAFIAPQSATSGIPCDAQYEPLYGVSQRLGAIGDWAFSARH